MGGVGVDIDRRISFGKVEVRKPYYMAYLCLHNLTEAVSKPTKPIHISYYTHSRAIRENIARVQGCIFTSPKDE